MMKDLLQLIGIGLILLLFMIWLNKNKSLKQEVFNYYLGRLKIIYILTIMIVIFVALIWRPYKEMNTKLNCKIISI